MAKVKPGKKDTFIDMTAMSDVTVLLLTFFMLTANFIPLEPVQVVTPASVIETKVPDYNYVTILVNPQGEIFLNLDRPSDKTETLEKMGYGQYEISNFAKPGYECRHNIGYWKRTEYLGLGLGASSLYGENRFSNTRDMQEYLGFSGNTERIRKDVLKLSLKDQIEEFMYLGLRMTEGISEIDFEQNFGQKLENIYGSVLQKYKETGFLEKTGTNWRFTRKGIHVSNHILAELLLDEE